MTQQDSKLTLDVLDVGNFMGDVEGSTSALIDSIKSKVMSEKTSPSPKVTKKRQSPSRLTSSPGTTAVPETFETKIKRVLEQEDRIRVKIHQEESNTQVSLEEEEKEILKRIVSENEEKRKNVVEQLETKTREIIDEEAQFRASLVKEVEKLVSGFPYNFHEKPPEAEDEGPRENEPNFSLEEEPTQEEQDEKVSLDDEILNTIQENIDDDVKMVDEEYGKEENVVDEPQDAEIIEIPKETVDVEEYYEEEEGEIVEETIVPDEAEDLEVSSGKMTVDVIDF